MRRKSHKRPQVAPTLRPLITPVVVPAELLLDVRTRYQHLQLRKDTRGLLLSLNGSPQVHSAEEREYHDCIATVPLLLSQTLSDVLILGGGDGLAARNVLAFDEVKSCTLVEIDPEMIAFASQHPLWREMNQGSLSNPRVEIVLGDGIAWMIQTNRRFDVIIHDLEMSFTEQPEAVTMARLDAFFSAMYAKLTPGGIWVITIDIDYDEKVPDAFFTAHEMEFNPRLRTAYQRRRGAIAKVRFLLQHSFACVRELTIAPPALGVHTTFYVSNEPFGTWRRTPPRQLALNWPRRGLRPHR